MFLGSSSGTQNYEPLLLGNKTVELLTSLMKALSDLGNNLTEVVTTPQGSPLTGVNTAGAKLTQKIVALQNTLKNITSEHNYTI